MAATFIVFGMCPNGMTFKDFPAVGKFSICSVQLQVAVGILEYSRLLVHHCGVFFIMVGAWSILELSRIPYHKVNIAEFA